MSVPRMRLRCTKQVGGLCNRPAVELLLIADGVNLDAKARCNEHLAADDVPILRRIMPLASLLVCPLPADGPEEL